MNREFREAAADFRTVVGLDPNSAAGHLGLAVVFTAGPDDGVRDIRRAVAHATRANELTGWANAVYLETLAAAHAAAGDFPAAARWQRKAIDHRPKDATSRAAAEERLRQFEAGEPVRDDVGVAPPDTAPDR